MTSGSTSTIVPANRLGQLLAEARMRTGADLQDMSERSGGYFTVGELADLEAGHRVLDDHLVQLVTSLYEIGCGTIIPQRAELTIDLDDKSVSAAGRAVRLDSTARDHILDRYLSLVYLLRNRHPGTPVPLRDEDLAILSASLAERSELIQEQLLAAMAADNDAVSGLVGWFKRRLWVPGAGVLVGAVSVGTLVMVTADSSTTGATATDDELEPQSDGPQPDVARVIGGPATTSAPARASSSPATPSSVPPSTAPADRFDPATLGARAEALLPFDIEATLPGWTVEYRGSDPDYRGLTFPYDKTVELYVRPTDTPESLAGILAHELGHALDVTYFDQDARQQWLTVRDRANAQWWPDAYASDFETGAGDFAEAFALWAIDDASSSRLAGPPDATELAVLETLVSPLLTGNS